ncbi:MAG: class I SAM-dependent methyltransferase [Clostridia bacterium]|nr:class I SAM-dependent methyltransferase [Clostridia bacterium]
MNKISMTALISAFSRGYHSEHNIVKIFDDSFANQLLTEEEKETIKNQMIKGISFFNPAFRGSDEEALRWIVDCHLSPSPLGRAAFIEAVLETAVFLGASQYLMVASGYDSFAYRQPEWVKKVRLFEIDYPMMISDKINRISGILERLPENLDYVSIDLTNEKLADRLIACADFSNLKVSFCSLSGISYYLTKEDFKKTINSLSEVTPAGSTIVFDYPCKEYISDERNQRQIKMAAHAYEPMIADYSYKEMEKLLSDCGYLIYENLNCDEITLQYFSKYNDANPKNRMTAIKGVNYCLAVRQK